MKQVHEIEVPIGTVKVFVTTLGDAPENLEEIVRTSIREEIEDMQTDGSDDNGRDWHVSEIIVSVPTSA